VIGAYEFWAWAIPLGAKCNHHSNFTEKIEVIMNIVVIVNFSHAIGFNHLRLWFNMKVKKQNRLLKMLSN